MKTKDECFKCIHYTYIDSSEGNCNLNRRSVLVKAFDCCNSFKGGNTERYEPEDHLAGDEDQW